MSWSVCQLQLLQAMGMDVLRQADPRATFALAATRSPTSSAPARRPSASAPSAGTSATTKAASSNMPAAKSSESLLQALRQAAGGREIADVIDDLERLRREPALKRALWPTLRTLRRTH